MRSKVLVCFERDKYIHNPYKDFLFVSLLSMQIQMTVRLKLPVSSLVKIDYKIAGLDSN